PPRQVTKSRKNRSRSLDSLAKWLSRKHRMTDPKHPAYNAFKYIGRHRRAVEHRRFVTGQGHYAADVALPGLLHVAIVASPYASARIVSIDTSTALSMPGEHDVLTGEELTAQIEPMLPGVDAPKVARYPLAR